MENIKALLAQLIYEGSFRKLTLSSPHYKSNEVKKIILEPIAGKNNSYLRFSSFADDKVKHENFSDYAKVMEALEVFLKSYGQCDIKADKNYLIISNKKGNYRLTESQGDGPKEIKTHNQKKNYIIQEGTPVDWLCQLGVMTVEGKVVKDKYNKFRQLNRFLEMIDDIYDYLPNDMSIVDIGCGKSYLTFALYHYLMQKEKSFRIIGIDKKTDVIKHCQSLAEGFGFDRLSFEARDILKLDPKDYNAHMVISLHACDIATDYSIYYGLLWQSRVIMAVPCCQHEANGQIKNEGLKLMLRHGIIKERFAALLTDSIRAGILDAYGYKTNVMEFIDLEHTPKNILIRAVNKGQGISQSKLTQVKELTDSFGLSQKLYNLLSEGL